LEEGHGCARLASGPVGACAVAGSPGCTSTALCTAIPLRARSMSCSLLRVNGGRRIIGGPQPTSAKSVWGHGIDGVAWRYAIEYENEVRHVTIQIAAEAQAGLEVTEALESHGRVVLEELLAQAGPTPISGIVTLLGGGWRTSLP
jgi:hypothetical protein